MWRSPPSSAADARVVAAPATIVVEAFKNAAIHDLF
jgi:hypothetical protein